MEMIMEYGFDCWLVWFVVWYDVIQDNRWYIGYN